ncbi:DUF937 domain-containing protein [Nocardioides sp. B-3]|nr:DUF937 domain-containing protein [Nocardioides sp. B-3]UUZ60033.1 DUF937 domain-containing protein [Nocardioides sp. B-3]
MADINELLSTLPIDQIASQLGEDPDEVRRAVDVALPALLGGLEANAADPGGEASLAEAVAQHDNDVATPPVDVNDVDVAEGQKIAAHIFGANQGPGGQPARVDRCLQRPGLQADPDPRAHRAELPRQAGRRQDRRARRSRRRRCPRLDPVQHLGRSRLRCRHAVVRGQGCRLDPRRPARRAAGWWPQGLKTSLTCGGVPGYPGTPSCVRGCST